MPVTVVVRVMAGVDVAVATVPAKPLFDTTETEVTVPGTAAVFPFNFCIASRIVSVAATVPAPDV
jgi:hypothetical protein